MDFDNIISETEDIFRAARAAGFFSGAALGISIGGKADKRRLTRVYGTNREDEAAEPVSNTTAFDLASLTKPLATTLLLAAMKKEKKLEFSQPVAVFFKKVPDDKEAITIRQLLSHSSGLPAHRPFYEGLQKKEDGTARQHEMERLILAEPLLYTPGSRSIYSDLGFLLLGFLVEKQSGKKIDDLFRERITDPLGLSEKIFFNRIGQIRAASYAATENCPWRGRVLSGEVSDENCFALGGVAGHAGLFGSIDGVLALVETIHDAWQGESTHPAIAGNDLKMLLTRQAVPGSTWALGFDTPSARNSSSGLYFSDASVGHLGFTGTSFWIDPVRHLCVVLLTNRVHPSRENPGIKEFRPRLHDAICRGLGLI